MNRGWVCPKCEKVYAPHIAQCWECNSREVTLCSPPLTTCVEFIPVKQPSDPLFHPLRIYCGSDGED